MIILTAANKNEARFDSGKIHKGFSFKENILETARSAERFGYKIVIYDLGKLGIGEKYYINNRSFQEKGFYENKVFKKYKSKSLFKPEIVNHCMNRYHDLIVFLDGDAQLCDRIDEINTDDYDIGVTVRSPSEIESEWHQEHFDIVKYLNAGVIFFKPTIKTRQFVNNWRELTEKVGNDQKALNKLACLDDYPEINTVSNIDGIKIKYFPCELYNYYYFDEGLVPGIKIMHFKGPVRRFFPFDKRKRLYCSFIVPIRQMVKKYIKWK